MTKPRFPHACISAAALGRLALGMERLADWHRSIGGTVDGMPCLREIEVSPSGRLTAHISLEHDAFIVLEYIDDRWEEKT